MRHRGARPVHPESKAFQKWSGLRFAIATSSLATLLVPKAAFSMVISVAFVASAFDPAHEPISGSIALTVEPVEFGSVEGSVTSIDLTIDDFVYEASQVGASIQFSGGEVFSLAVGVHQGLGACTTTGGTHEFCAVFSDGGIFNFATPADPIFVYSASSLDYSLEIVPEPSTALLLAMGLLGLAIRRLR